VTAALEYGFTTLGLNRVELWIADENIASQRLAQKLGFQQRGQFYAGNDHHPNPHETLVFGLRADEWATRNHKPIANSQREIPFLNVHPILSVNNVSESIKFYRDRLGFNTDYVGGYPPDFAVMSRGEWITQRVHLQLRRSDQPAITHLFIMVGPAIDRLHDEYRANGVRITQAPTTQPWGIRDFSIEDNDGNQIKFGANA
jgi:catechol 2,3-dioxygenase-like lactoylglutathione lyase family enzyme